MKLIRWPVWLVSALVITGYVVAGFQYDHDNRVANDLFGVSHVIVAAAALLFILIYTGFGIWGAEPRPRWWRNDLGFALVAYFFSSLIQSSVFVYIAYWHQDMLNQPLPVWIYVSGPCISAIAIMYLTWVWIRSELTRRDGDDPKATAVTPAEEPGPA